MRIDLFFTVATLVAISLKSITSQETLMDEFDMDEELLFAKYQSLISATISGKDIAVEDIPESSIDTSSIVEESIPDEFLQRMLLEEALESQSRPSSETLEDLSTSGQQFNASSVALNSSHDTADDNNQSLSENPAELDLVTNTTVSPTYVSATENGKEIEETITMLDSKRLSLDESNLEAKFTVTVPESLPIIVDEATIPVSGEEVSIPTTDSATSDSHLSVTCPDTVAEHLPLYLMDNPIVEGLMRLSGHQDYLSIVPTLNFLMTDFEHHVKESTSCKSDNQTFSCVVDGTSLDRLQLVDRDKVALCQQQSIVYKEQNDILQAATHKAEQQRDLSDIRLKKCRNEITVLKVSAEQQQLAVEEAKVELEFRLKELQRENARLRLVVEDLKRSKNSPPVNAAHDCFCDTAGSSTISGSSLATNAAKMISSSSLKTTSSISHDTKLVDSSKSSLDSTGMAPPQSHEDVASAGRIKSYSDSSKTSDVSLGGIIGTQIPSWCRKKLFPYLLSFVAWEYRMLWYTGNLIVQVVDPRLWNVLQSHIFQPIRVQWTQWRLQLAAAEDGVLQSDPHSITSTIFKAYHSMERFILSVVFRYLEIVSTVGQSTLAPKDGLLAENSSRSVSINDTATLNTSHYPNVYIDLVDTVFDDIESVYRFLHSSVISIQQMKLLFGSNVENISHWIVSFGIIISAALCRKIILGMIVSLALAIFLPIVLVLLCASSIIGLFMPRRKKIIKKKVRRISSSIDQKQDLVGSKSLPSTNSVSALSLEGGPPSVGSFSTNHQQSTRTQKDAYNSNQGTYSSSPRTFIGMRA